MDGVEFINYGFAVRVDGAVENSGELKCANKRKEFPGLGMKSGE